MQQQINDSWYHSPLGHRINIDIYPSNAEYHAEPFIISFFFFSLAAHFKFLKE